MNLTWSIHLSVVYGHSGVMKSDDELNEISEYIVMVWLIHSSPVYALVTLLEYWCVIKYNTWAWIWC